MNRELNPGSDTAVLSLRSDLDCIVEMLYICTV